MSWYLLELSTFLCVFCLFLSYYNIIYGHGRFKRCWMWNKDVCLYGRDSDVGAFPETFGWGGRGGRGGRRGGGRKSTSNQKFNLVSILMSTELKCQQKCSHTWKTFNAFWTLAFFPPALVSQIHLQQMGEVCRRPCNGTGPSPWKLKLGACSSAELQHRSFIIDPDYKKNPNNCTCSRVVLLNPGIRWTPELLRDLLWRVNNIGPD